LNGSTSPLVNVGSLNTRNTANSYCNGTQVTCVGSTNPTVLDDYYMFNDQAPAPATFQGDVRAVQQMPNADVSVTWTPNSGAIGYNRVNEAHQDGDTSYVLTNTVNNVDQYAIAALATTPLSIIAVQSKMYARMDDAGPHTVKSRLTSTGTTSDSANMSCASTYKWIQQIYAVDPHTTSPWTAPNLNAVTIGPFDVV
jgi:hypothetical protein